ncbi:MAG TPA: hypothetical protein VJR89_01735 [Polyangiales bacterium]|nr:hypothetical protein [Polyangiales bacterium]
MRRATAALWVLGCVGCASSEPTPCESQSGVVCAWAGTGELGFDGDGRARQESRLYWPADLTFGPDGRAWVLDWNNHAIRKVNEDQTFETVVGNFFVGDGPPDFSDLTAPGARGTDVALNHPTDLQFGGDGKLYFAAWHNHKLRTVDPHTGLVQVMCGRGPGYSGDGGPAAGALFNQPKAIAIDDDGAIFVLDQRNFRIRKIDGSSDATIATIAGTGKAGYAGDEGPAVEALMNFETGGNPEPSGALALGPDHALYVADALNQRIRRIDLASGQIETIAGTGEAGYSGDGGPAIEAQLNNVKDLEFGPDGRLYLADTDNHRIRAIDLKKGRITTVAGNGKHGVGELGVAPEDVELNRPFGIAFDAGGALFIADTFNSRILEVMP